MNGAPPAIHDTGEGAALLLLHAFPLDASQWDHQVAALSGQYRCVRPDYWGCGASPAPPESEPSLDAYATALLEGLREMGVDRFHLVGCSMGGYISFAVLRQAAQRVLSLMLVSTRATSDTEQGRQGRLALADTVIREQSVESIVEANIERLLGPRARAEVHVTDPVRGRIRRCTPAGVAHAARAMAARPDSSAQLASIETPTLVVSGREDVATPRDDVDAMVTGIRGARLITMSTGHLCNLEEPPAFTEEARRFLESLSSAAA
jgi:pimeloyl-ACP methyl ester carboxylesterase